MSICGDQQDMIAVSVTARLYELVDQQSCDVLHCRPLSIAGLKLPRTATALSVPPHSVSAATLGMSVAFQGTRWQTDAAYTLPTVRANLKVDAGSLSDLGKRTHW